MIGNDFLKLTIVPYPRKALVPAIWIAVKYSSLTVSKEYVQTVVRKSMHFFNAIHHHGKSPQRIGSTHTTSLPSMQSFQFSMSSSVRMSMNV